MSNLPPGPGRVIQSRLTARAHGGIAEAALDSNKTAWARCFTDGEQWTPWVLVADGVVDVDIAAIPDDNLVALVVVTPAAGRGRVIFSLAFNGTLTPTQS